MLDVAMVALAGELLQRLDDSGEPFAAPQPAHDVGAIEEAERPRWLWASSEHVYPKLLSDGVRVRRCHDLELVEGILLAHDGRYGAPRNVLAAHARLTGGREPPDTPPQSGTLFEPLATASLEMLRAVYQAQRRRLDGPLRLLAAAESASGLIAAEMGHDGLPWRADAHDELLHELLGQPVGGGMPRKLAELAVIIGEMLDAPGLHPDSPAELVRALRRAGVDVPNTRSWTLKRHDHPVIPVLVEWRELYRIWTAHGWSWRQQWVRDGRFRPAYVPAGVVSGRWATRGGGALQIPKAVRGAVRADPGWKLVVADAGQLEPRILAAVSQDEGLGRAAAQGDL
jgi:DNA polymerase-1